MLFTSEMAVVVAAVGGRVVERDISEVESWVRKSPAELYREGI
jgi:hypothetical protein